MKKFFTALFAVSVLTGVGGFETEAQAHHLDVKASQAHRPGCQQVYHRKRMYGYAKTRYTRRKKPLTEGQNVYIRHVAWCLPTREGTTWAFEKRKQWRSKFRKKLAYYRLTPFVCGNGTRWAIPCYIVYCESHYSWMAYNPSGAVGPYQLLGWGAIYPARTWKAKMQNHRIARRLYLSQGSSPWVCS